MVGQFSDSDPIGRLQVKHSVEQVKQLRGQLAVKIIPFRPELCIGGSWTNTHK